MAWAQTTAEEMLRGTGNRWHHVFKVGQKAEKAGTILGKQDQETLVAAAFLHDIGHAPEVVSTGFHQLDGAVWLRSRGVEPRVCSLVAHHSAARYEAAERGLCAEMDEFEVEESPVMDLLVFLDMTTGPDGKPMQLHERVRDILQRYPVTDPVHRAMLRAYETLAQSVERSRQRLLRAGPYPM